MKSMQVLFAFATLLLLSEVFAREDVCEAVRFEYEQKLKQVESEAYRRGWEDAMAYVRERLEALKKDFYALEVGKYLVRKGLITAPRVYKYINEDGETVIKVLGCRIEDVRQLSQIFEEGIYIPQCSEIRSSRPLEVKTGIDVLFKKTFPKKRAIKEVLDELNIPYEITPNGYQVIFSSPKEYESFCRATRVCE